MSRNTSRMSAEERAADQAAKLEQRLQHRDALDLHTLEDFLRGKISFNAISKGANRGGTRIDRAYPRLDKMLVAWVLILANPSAFSFRLTKNGLVGALSNALYAIYPDDSYINDTSLNNGLHVKHERTVKATPSIALVALVHEHIGNPDGGIAKYFREREQEPPTELDIEIIRAVCPNIQNREDIPAPTVINKAKKTAAPSGRVSKAEAAVDQHVQAVAQRALQELQELYGPKVLAALKHLL